MGLFDTNLLSDLMRPQPDAGVLEWAAAQPSSTMATTAISVMEVRFGLARLPDGRRRAGLEARFEELLRRGLADRVLAFDAAAAEHAARIRGERRQAGHPVTVEDSMIAGIARAKAATIITRDGGGFADCGVPVVDPWTDAG